MPQIVDRSRCTLAVPIKDMSRRVMMWRLRLADKSFSERDVPRTAEGCKSKVDVLEVTS